MAGFNIFSALARGAEDAINHRVAQRDEQRRYELLRSRALAEEAERRNRALQYGEEDYGIKRGREQQEYDLGINRDEGEYGIKRSRALKEREENQALKDIERERMINTGALIGKEINDPRYAHQTIAKAWGLPDIPDTEQRQLERDLKQSQINYYNARGNKALTSGVGKTSGSGAPKSALDNLTKVGQELKRLIEIRDGRDTFGNPIIPLNDKQHEWLKKRINELETLYEMGLADAKGTPNNASDLPGGDEIAPLMQMLGVQQDGRQNWFASLLPPWLRSLANPPLAGAKALAVPSPALPPEQAAWTRRRPDGGRTFAPAIENLEAWLSSLWNAQKSKPAGGNISGLPAGFGAGPQRSF